MKRWPPIFLLVLAVAGGTLAGCAQASVGAPAAQVQPAAEGDCHRAESARFVFQYLFTVPASSRKSFPFETLPRRPAGRLTKTNR
jgi:hypothetical protein